ncbi:hypothetical protein AO741_09445 [Pseudomonas sp. TTU2014-105ASC]|nr:hypothetical protein AO741_09445 [Pseudomonas sp. TTU2014-105ASC]
MASEAQMNQLQSLYIAYFGRPADAAGVTYWTPIIDGGTSFDEIASRFMDSDEFTATSSDLNDVVTAAYANGLGREAGADEVAFWVGQIEAGNETVASLLEAFRSTDDATDRQTLENKILVANAYTAAAVAGAEFDTAASVALLAGVDSTQASVDAALEEIGAEAPAEGSFAAYEAAIANLNSAEGAYAAALVKAGVAGVTENADGTYTGFTPSTTDYVLGAEQAVLDARSDLNTDRTDNGSDASLQQALQQAQTDVNKDAARYDILGNKVTVATDGTATYAEDPTEEDNSTALRNADDTADIASGDAYVGSVYTAAQLQARANTAEAALDAHEAGEGATLELATQLEDAIALYQATQATPNADLSPLVSLIDALQVAGTALAADPSNSTLQGAFETAQGNLYVGINDAYDKVFQVAVPANAGKSNLDTGARGDAVEALLATLNERADLAAADDAASAVFEVKVDTGPAFVLAENAVENREALIEAIATAQANLEAISAADADYQAAVEALETATEALGFAVQTIDGAIELATSEADLFVFDAEKVDGIDAIFINNLGSDDQILLGSAYALGTAGAGNNNVLEVFITEVNGSAVLQVENSVYGSNDGANGDFTTITLTGVAAADITFDNGVVSFA